MTATTEIRLQSVGQAGQLNTLYRSDYLSQWNLYQTFQLKQLLDLYWVLLPLKLNSLNWTEQTTLVKHIFIPIPVTDLEAAPV